MPILVNVPYLKPHKLFLPHFTEWYAANKISHDLRLNFQMWKALHKAQQLALLYAREFKCSHILWTEDDHFGFPVDGLDVLLAHDLDVVGFCSYRKAYPYAPLNYRKEDPSIKLTDQVRNIRPFYGEGVETCDLIGWNFLLTKVDVFDTLEANGHNVFESWDFSPTDSTFCQACLDCGIQPHVSFEATIGHGNITPFEIPFHRRMHESMDAARGRFPKTAVETEDERVIAAYVPEVQKAIEDLKAAD